MASTYSTNLALELIGTGDQAGTWGVTTNTNLGTLLEQAISGYVTQAVSTGTDTTITIPNGSTGVARNMYIELTGTGGTNTNLIVPANKKLYFIFNNASGAVTVKVSGQTGVSVPAGKKMILVSNGTDIVNGVNYIADFGTNSFTVTNLTATSATITNLIATTATVSDLSATVLRAASASITNLALTSLTISSLSITNVSVASATVSSNLTLSGGTANGVLYLNGSKVATSGTGLVFDGTRLFLGTTAVTTSSSQSGEVYSTGSAGFLFTNSTAANYPVSVKNEGTSGTRRLINFYEGAAGGTARANISIDGSNGIALTVGSGTTTFDSSGNVGIGTSSPTIGLSVEKDNGSGYIAAFRANNTSPYLTIQTTGGITQLQGINSAFSATNDIAMQISGGNVGIGTSSPTQKLHVAGNILSLSAAGTDSYVNVATSGIQNTYVGFNNSGSTNASGVLNNYSYFGNGNAYGLQFITNGAVAATISTAGNLGLGVTPSAWTSPDFRGLQVGSGIAVYGRGSGDADRGGMAANAYNDGAWKYIATGNATRAEQSDGQHLWFTAASGTAGNAITFTQAMTLDAAGNLGLGTSSPQAYSGFTVLTVDNTTNGGIVSIRKNGTVYGNISPTSNNMTIDAVESSASIVFRSGVSSTERARITSGGYFKASNTGGYDNATGAYHELLNNDASDAVVLVTHFGATNPLGIGVAFTAASPDDNTQYFLRCADSTTARCFIYSDGDLANHDGVYGTISDERLKQDIVDAPSQWDDLKAVRFRKYRMKTDVEANPNAPALLGVVAQELEQTSPGLIDEHPNDDGTTTKTVKSSILLMKAAVALQEAMTRIEQLEAKVAALESK